MNAAPSFSVLFHDVLPEAGGAQTSPGRSMRFPARFLDEIRLRVPLSQVVGRHVQWDRRRSNPARGDWWACCPFHHEKTPSFHADDRKGFYYCFGCHAKGDVITFLVEKEGLDFAEAVAQLAQEAGLELPQPDPHAERREEERASLHDVLELAARFYEMQLALPEGEAARVYVQGRGLSEETIRRFRLGFAPDARDALLQHLRKAGVEEALMAEAGLIAVPEDGGRPYDRFRNRLMFPIRDGRGRVIAFGGRALGEARAKYLNSPETPLFDKSRVLYNLDLARPVAFERGAVIAVEGYMDVIALDQAGFPHVVAPLGTALTEGHLALLWRMAAEPVLCFDGDAAGMKAAWRALELALPHLAPGHSLRFALLPEGMDPDDLVREQGAEAFAAVLEAARPLIDMLWHGLVDNRTFSTPEERARLEADLEALVMRIGDAKVRAHYLREVRSRLRDFWRGTGGAGAAGRSAFGGGGVRRRAGMAVHTGGKPRAGAMQARMLHAGGREAPSPGLISKARERDEAFREREILRIVLRQPEILDEVFEELAELPFSSPALDSLRGKILDIAAGHAGLDSARLLAHLQDEGAGADVVRLAGRAISPDRQEDKPDLDLRRALASFREHARQLRRTAVLERELQAAEQAFGKDPSEENLERILRLREELQAARRLAGE